MAHAFDTGATVAQRSRVRAAIITKLAPLKRSADPALYINAIKPLPRLYRGEGDVEGLDMLVTELNGQAPAIGVALGRLTLDPAGQEPTDVAGELEVSVYVASQHQRSLIDGRLAADAVATGSVTADPGIETALEHVGQLLIGQGLDIDDVRELRAVSEDIVATFADITIAELRLSLHCGRDVNPARGVSQLVTEAENQLSSEDIPEDIEVGEDEAPLVPLVTTVATLPEP